MNLANLTPAWLKRFVVQRMITKDDFESFSPKPIEQPSLKLSCLAKGIVKSMEEHPEEWEKKEVEGYLCVVHAATKMDVRVGWLDVRVGWFVCVDEKPLSEHDARAVNIALDNLINGPARKAAAERRTIFEKLGCPDQEVSTDSSKVLY